MRIALISVSAEPDLGRLAQRLEQRGLEILYAQRQPGGNLRVPEPIDRCFLVSPESGVMHLGELTMRLREQLPQSVSLFICAPRPTAADREVLHECGGAEILTPGGWRSHQVAERILAQVILDGAIRPASLGSLLGATEAMQHVYRRIEMVAPLEEPVLVLGETGTGKELAAREIHQRSGRPGGFLAINCAALTPSLVESELFGHERGAFSGADKARRGLLVEAGKGTVFLDEIGDLASESQAKLLRVLEERTVRPVGGNRWTAVESRIVLATHRDLERAVAERAFREDLLHRIRGFVLELPPLRDRMGDLLILAHHFLAEYGERYPGERTVPPGALDPLFRYHWPGNVRELRQAMWQAATFSSPNGGPIGALSIHEWSSRSRREAGPRAQMAFDPETDTWRDVQDRLRTAYFAAVLKEAGGNKELAAHRAGVSRSQFYEILRQIQSEPLSDQATDDGS